MTPKNKCMNALFIIFFLASFLPFISSASASESDCSINQPMTLNVPMQTITPSEKGAIGTVLDTYELAIPKIKYSCGANKFTTWTSEFVRGGMTKAILPNVYGTNVQGIGIRVKWPVSHGSSWVPGNYTCQGGCILPTDKMIIEFIQTDVAVDGTIPAGPLLEVKISDNDYPEEKYNLLNINIGEITVNIRACSIIASKSNIDLGEYYLADVNNPQFTGAKKDFSITLNCPAKSSATIRFEGKHAWGQGSGVLETDGSAKYVFVTLYTKRNTRYTELILNEDINFGSASSFIGTREVKYAAEMTFMDSMRKKVTVGDVKASVIYTLTIN